MATAATLVVQIIADASKAVSAFKQTGQAAETSGKAASTTSSKIAKIGAAIATGYVATKVVGFAKSTVQAAYENQKAQATLAQVFRATGEATGEAAKHAGEFADTLGRQIGVSPEVIMQSQAMLATFRNVSSESARQSGIFDQATTAAANLAAAGFGDMAHNSVILGKALNDPTKGLTALQRIGITFSKSQTDQIKHMQATGNIAGAQKAILAELGHEVGGVAAKTATSSAKMGVAWDELKVKMGTGLLPYLDRFKSTLSGVISFVSANSSWLMPLAMGMGIFAGAIWAAGKAMDAWKTIQMVWNGVMSVGRVVMLNFGVAIDLGFGPIILIIAAIVAFIAIIVILYLKCAWFRAAVAAIWGGIRDAAVAAFHAIATAISWLVGWIGKNWPLLIAVLTGPIGVALFLVIHYFSAIKSGVVTVVGSIIGWLASAGASIFHWLTWPYVQAWSLIVSGAQATASWFSGMAGRIGSALAGVFGAIIGPFQSAWNWVQSNILNPLRTAWNTVANAINSVHVAFVVPGPSVLGHKLWPDYHFNWSPPFHIPTLASGGYVRSEGLAYLHAAETVTPGPGSSAREVHIHLHVPPTANPAETGRQTVKVLQAYVRAQGSGALANALGLAAS